MCVRECVGGWGGGGDASVTESLIRLASYILVALIHCLLLFVFLLREMMDYFPVTFSTFTASGDH